MTNEPKFTPGPWSWESEIFHSFCVFPTDEVTGARSAFFCDIDSRDPEEGIANARLISKAPEMYNLLKEAIFLHEQAKKMIMEKNIVAADGLNEQRYAVWDKALKLLSQIDGTEGE